ncbi:MAG TPA: T9SS type A sorting domain-containing protein [Edaphocola sp.]|nr:T9SS type A sorting domain-containing protein [Edaphocola sp.]
MKKSLLCLSLGLLVAGAVQAQTYVNEDFNSVSAPTLPSSWTSHPSGLWATGAPNSVCPNGMSLVGYDLSATGHEKVAGVNGNTNANNSVLTTPSFNLPSSASGVYLTFDLCYLGLQYTADASLHENLYLVYTTDGGSTWNNIQEIQANSNYLWEMHAIDVSSLAGTNNIELGFKYTNADTVLMGALLDNVKVAVAPSNEMALLAVTPQQGDANAYASVNSNITISGAVQNNGASAITSYTVYVQEGNNTPTSTQETANIAPFSTGTFSDVTYTVPSLGAHNLKVWVSLNGDADNSNDTATAYVEGVSFSPTKHLVFEEATGAWCGWCPRGAVGMKTMAQQYGSLAALISVHDNDAMAISSYDALITGLPGFTGFPTVVVDRTFLGDPGPQSIVDMYNQYKDNFGFAGVTMQQPSISGNSVSINVDVKPAVDIAGAKLALVVTENGVTGTGSGYEQHNYYAGGGSGVMGGYENLPSVITDEVFEFVARSITPSADGGASGLPSTMTAGNTYSATLTATLDPSWNQDSLKYVVMLIGQDGKILNSDFTGSSLGITNVDAGLKDAAIYPNPATQGLAHISVNAKQSTQAQLTITDMTGRVVYSGQTVNLNAGNNTVTVSTASLANGAYMVNLNTEKGNISLKLNVIK